MENLTKTHYLLHFSHIGHLRKWPFFDVLGVQKWGPKPEASKKSKQHSKILPRGRQGRKQTPTGSKMTPRGVSKIGQKSDFFGSWATGVPQRVPKASPGTPWSSKLSQNWPKIDTICKQTSIKNQTKRSKTQREYRQNSERNTERNQREYRENIERI